MAFIVPVVKFVIYPFAEVKFVVNTIDPELMTVAVMYVAVKFVIFAFVEVIPVTFNVPIELFVILAFAEVKFEVNTIDPELMTDALI